MFLGRWKMWKFIKPNLCIKEGGISISQLSKYCFYGKKIKKFLENNRKRTKIQISMRASKVSKKNKSHRRFTSTNEAKYYKKYHTDIFLLVRKHKILKYFQSHFLCFQLKRHKKREKKSQRKLILLRISSWRSNYFISKGICSI